MSHILSHTHCCRVISAAQGGLRWAVVAACPHAQFFVLSPYINVTHARIFPHITHKLTPFQPLSTAPYSHIVTLFSPTLCVTTLRHHHVEACFQYTNYLRCNGDTKHASAWWRHNNDETRSMNENKCVMRRLATGTRVTEWKCGIACNMICRRRLVYLRTLLMRHTVGVEK